MGALTLTGSMVIDFGTLAGNTLKFSSVNFTPGFILSIWNWTGSRYPQWETSDTGGNREQDRLAFTSQPDLAGSWDRINFFSDNGVTELGHAQMVAFEGGFELVPVPEPTTILGGILLIGLIGYRERRRVRALTRHFLQKLAA